MIQDIEHTDSRLLAAWTQQGDQQALTTLVNRYAPMVMGVCRRQCRRLSDAEDAFQVTFMILARSAHTIRRSVALPAWLHATAMRVAIRARNRQPQETDEGLEHVPSSENTLDEVARRHELRVLDEELAKLPDAMRAALVLHYLDGHQLTEVAQQLDTTLGSIRGRLQRGRDELRRRLILRGVSFGAVLIMLRCTSPIAQAAAQAALAGQAVAGHPSCYQPVPTYHPPLRDSSPNLFFPTSSGAMMKVTVLSTAASLLLTMWAASSRHSGSGETDMLARQSTAPPAIPAQDAEVDDVAQTESALFQLAPTNTPANSAYNPSDNPQPTDNASEVDSPASSESGTGGPVGPTTNPSDATPAAGIGPTGNSPLSPSNSPSPFTQIGGQAGMGGMGGGMGGMGGGIGGMGGGTPSPAAKRPERQPSDFELQLETIVQSPIEATISVESVAELAQKLSSAYQIPVAIAPSNNFEGVLLDQGVEISGTGLPLIVGLKSALRPLKLRPIIRDDALMIVPDTAALAKEGIGTSKYINVDDAFVKKMEQALSKPLGMQNAPRRDRISSRPSTSDPFGGEAGKAENAPQNPPPAPPQPTNAPFDGGDDSSVSSRASTVSRDFMFEQTPLRDVLKFLEEKLTTEDGRGVQIRINHRAFEDLGLTEDFPVTIDLRDTTAETVLDTICDANDLTLRPRNSYLEITTMENAEDPSNALIRIYWLDGTGFWSLSSAMELIQTSIEPDTWDAIGGPSTMASLNNSNSGRVGLVISTTYHTHRQIEQLLDSIREGIVDPTTEIAPENPAPAMNGGMGGMGGGMF